jgi:type IV pilus assembly protein PilB
MKKSKKRLKIGEVLRDRGQISPEDLQKVIADQQGKMIHLGEFLLERGLVPKAEIASALEEVLDFQYADCATVTVSPNALKLIPFALAERFLAMPIRLDGKFLVVAMAEPQNLAIVEELRFTTGFQISPRAAFRFELREAIHKHYHAEQNRLPAEVVDKLHFEDIEFISTSQRQSNQEAMQEMQADLRQSKTPAVRLVSEIIQAALAKQASDIHIEPRSAETIVRIRIDGVLRDLNSIPRMLQNALISRIKILSDMDIAERRTPQDGRFMVNVGLRQIDLRVSTLPTQYGEKVVIRLLESSAQTASFAELGIPSDVSTVLSELLSMPQGMVLVTGPTGSGKSTTLYSALSILRRPSVNIVTVEDPVEYVLPGISQSHVNRKAGLTFATCLRSILRQDPNIIMVGEIRDGETAEIAMKAAQTGHLVLSTLHTNDSISAIARLIDLGVPPFLVSTSLTGILAQRLVRKLCSCHSVRQATPEYQARLVLSGVKTPSEKMSVPFGCQKCDQTGYKGRIGIFEMLRFDESIREIIRVGGRTNEIRDAARSCGMRTIQEDAIAKLNSGLTSLEEILRVVSFESAIQGDCPECGHSLLSSFLFCPHCGIKRTSERSSFRSGTSNQIPEGVLQ